MEMKKSLQWALAATALSATPLMSAVASAQGSKSGVPQAPTTKDGKCAKANGGVYDARRNGWYTRDLLNYKKCMSGQ
jgi:hypothetical protein